MAVRGSHTVFVVTAAVAAAAAAGLAGCGGNGEKEGQDQSGPNLIFHDKSAIRYRSEGERCSVPGERVPNPEVLSAVDVRNAGNAPAQAGARVRVSRLDVGRFEGMDDDVLDYVYESEEEARRAWVKIPPATTRGYVVAPVSDDTGTLAYTDLVPGSRLYPPGTPREAFLKREAIGSIESPGLPVLASVTISRSGRRTVPLSRILEASVESRAELRPGARMAIKLKALEGFARRMGGAMALELEPPADGTQDTRGKLLLWYKGKVDGNSLAETGEFVGPASSGELMCTREGTFVP